MSDFNLLLLRYCVILFLLVAPWILYLWMEWPGFAALGIAAGVIAICSTPEDA